MDATVDRSGEVIEKFKLERLLGEGGMGQVYVATHQLTDRKVAIKILHKEFANNEEILVRLKREAKASAIIGHPNVVEIIDAGTDQYGAPYIAMELLNGEELDKFLERRGPLPIPLAAYIVSEILDTLEAAHAKGVIHRDLKPENIFLHWPPKATYPQIKILDFGISKFLSMEGKDLSLTRTGTVMGTPYYMSVEQAMGQKDIDHRTDIYAVGVILYQLLTNHVPYEDTNYNRVLIQIVTGSFPKPSEYREDIPPELEAIILKAMAKNRDERYASASEFRKALEPFWAGYDPAALFSEDGALPAPKLKETDGRNVLDSQALTAVAADAMPTGGMEGEGHRASPDKRRYMVLAVSLIAAAFIVGTGFFMLMPGGEDEQIVLSEEDPGATSPAAMAPEQAMKPRPLQPVMAGPKPMAESKPQPGAGAQKASTMAAAEDREVQFTLKIRKLPKKAVVLLDGKRIKVPIKLKWHNRDIHNINVKAPGFEAWGTRLSTKMVKDGKLVLTFRAKKTQKHASRKKKREATVSQAARKSKPTGKKPGGKKHDSKDTHKSLEDYIP